MSSSSSPMLGVFDDYMSLRADSFSSTTKLGGTPRYFFGSSSTSSEVRQRIQSWERCGVCGSKLFLLAQAYAPAPSFAIPAGAAAHHRMLYVFCCNSVSCAEQPRESWRAFAVQVDEEDEEAFGDGAASLEDEDYLTDPLAVSALPTAVFPPCHLQVLREPDEEEAGGGQTLPPPSAADASKWQAMLAKKTEDESRRELEELDQNVNLKNSDVDMNYQAFQHRLAREPTQVLRYLPAPSAPLVAAPPLFMNPEQLRKHFVDASPAKGETKKGRAEEDEEESGWHLLDNSTLRHRCEKCGGPLRAELQIMPTALYYLHPADYLTKAQRDHAARVAATTTTPSSATAAFTAMDTACLDFATATVYTCAAFCSTAKPGPVVSEAYLLLEAAPKLDEKAAQDSGNRVDLRAFMCGAQQQQQQQQEE